MKKILTLAIISSLVACTKPEVAPKVITPTTCDTGGIVGAFYAKRYDGGNGSDFFDEILLEAVGSDSFAMSFPLYPPYKNGTFDKFYSAAKPCRKLEFVHSHISMDGYILYVYMRGDTLVDSFVLNDNWIRSIYYTANR